MKTRTLTQTNETKIQQSRIADRVLSWCRSISSVRFRVVLLAAAFVLAATAVRASDPIGVFARIDKVVLEPNDSSPERIQLWGSFCLADEKDRDSYLAPEKGYLFYKLPAEKSEAALKEWNDLKATAGSGDVIGFGSRHVAKAKVRTANEKPENPDVYPVAFGLVKSNRRSSTYGPIKALQAGAGKKASESKESAPK
jgi:hypothetical protein